MKPVIFLYLLILLIIKVNAQWEPDLKLSTYETNAITSSNNCPCIAVNGNEVYVVWWELSGGIYYKRSTDAGVTWSSDTRLPGTSNYVDYPSIAVVGNNVHVVYRDTVNGIRNSYYIRSTDNGNTWDNPKHLGNYYYWPSISASGNNVNVSLNSYDSGNSEVWFRHSTNNGTNWQPAVKISDASGISDYPSIASENNNVHIAWNDRRNGNYEIYYRRSTDNGVTWSSEINLSMPSGNSNTNPMLYVNGNNIELVWKGISHIIYRNSSDYGYSWSDKDSLSKGNPFSGYSPSIVRDGMNEHLVCFNIISFTINYQNSFDGGQTWNPDTNLVKGNSSQNPFIAVTGTVLHLIWIDNRNGHYAVYYKRNPTGNGGAPDNSILVSSTPTQLCAGTSFLISYQTTGTYLDDNIFTAQISDGYGDFANPTDIGKINSKNPGTITATLPPYLFPARGYRVRVNSSSPVTTGFNNGTDITINVLPSPIINGSSEVCRNSSLVYTADNISGYSYLWSVIGGNILGDDNQNTVQVNWNSTNNSGTVSLRETIVSTGCSDSLSQDIIIKDLPVPSITGLSQVCDNSTSMYSATPFTGHSYQWRVAGGTIAGTDNLPDVQIIWNTTDSTGTIILNESIDSTGCLDSVLKNIVVNPLPVPTISGPLTSLKDTNQTYSVTNNPGSFYKWFVQGGEFISTDTLPEVVIHWGEGTSGHLKCIETNNFDCSDSNEITVALFISSVQDNSGLGNLQLKIIPNPVNGKAKIEITVKESFNANIQIVNSYGDIVKEFSNVMLLEGTQDLDWEGTDMNGILVPSGIYFIKLSSKYGVIATKAVLLR